MIWLASNDATTRVEIAGDDAHAFEGYTAEDGVEFGESPVLMADNDGSIWVASLYRDEPILRFDGSLWRPPKLPSDAPALAGISPQVSALLRAKDGALWVGLFEDGILRLAGDSWTRYSEKHGIPRQQVWRMLEDSDGRMWTATGGGGLRRFSPSDGLWERVEFQRRRSPRRLDQPTRRREPLGLGRQFYRKERRWRRALAACCHTRRWTFVSKGRR